MATPSRSEPTAARRRLAPAERRRELLDAAVAVLRAQGPDRCRVEDITSAAGTAKGNFYRYFPTWDDLLVAVRDHLRDGYAAEVRRRMADQAVIDWWAVLEEESLGFLRFQLDLGGLHDAVFHGPAARTRPIDDRHSAAALVADLLRGGMREGAFAVVDPEPTASLVFHLLHGAADDIRAGAEFDVVAAAVLEVLRGALRPFPSDEPARP